MAENTYQWARGESNYNVAPERAAELFRQIEQRDGTLTPAGLVDASRAEDAPFHAAFDWDDAHAAESYRRQQARKIIGNLVFVAQRPDTKKELHTRAFVSVVALNAAPAEDRGDVTVTGYISLDTVMGDSTLRRQYLRAAARDLAAWRRKYNDLKELADILAMVDTALAQLAMV